MFSKRSSRGNEPVPRRRHVADDDSKAGASAGQSNTSGSQFRRNQTLSSYRHNTPDESTRQKAHQLAYQRRRISGIFSIVFVAVVLLLLLLWQLMAQVHATTSTKQLSQSFEGAAYEKSINEYLMINPSQRLRFALNEDTLSSFVATDFPEVESLKARGGAGLGQANITVTFRTPIAGWLINEDRKSTRLNSSHWE